MNVEQITPHTLKRNSDVQKLLLTFREVGRGHSQHHLYERMRRCSIKSTLFLVHSDFPNALYTLYPKSKPIVIKDDPPPQSFFHVLFLGFVAFFFYNLTHFVFLPFTIVKFQKFSVSINIFDNVSIELGKKALT